MSRLFFLILFGNEEYFHVIGTYDEMGWQPFQSSSVTRKPSKLSKGRMQNFIDKFQPSYE